jgi:hypothetical protein
MRSRLKPSLCRASLRGRLSLLVGGSLGAALAALVIASGLWPPASRATPLKLPRLSLRDNKQHLSSAEMTTLLRWARRYRACAVRHGVELDPAIVGENEVLISGRGQSRIRELAFRRQLPCFRELGDPPAFTAFALMTDRRLHLYRPRTCRLPVVGPAQG